MKLQTKKKGLTLGDIPGAVVILAISVIVLAVSISVLSTLQATQTVDSAAYNATGAGITGLSTFNDYWTLIGIVVVFSIILGLMVGFFAFRKRGGY